MPKTILQSLTDFRVPLLREAVQSDTLFCFRCDESKTLTPDTTKNFLVKCKVKLYMISSEIASGESKKPHHHVIAILDCITYKHMEKLFTEYVKSNKLESHQFSKKKNDYRKLTKSKKFQLILEKYNMKYIDYLPCYMSKDYDSHCEAVPELYITTFETPFNVFKSRYDIIRNELLSDTKKTSLNHMSILIKQYENSQVHKNYPNLEMDLFQHDNFQQDVFRFVVKYFNEVNASKPLAQILNRNRLGYYCYTLACLFNDAEITKAECIPRFLDPDLTRN